MQNKRLLSSRQITLETLAVGVGGLLLFTLGLWHQEFTGFETRFAVFAKEMLRLGPSIFPKTYGEPYPDYPATSTFLIWLISLPFGEVNKFTAIFPTAVACAINLALTYHLLSRISRHWAFVAVCFELLTATFLVEARTISLDQILATITLGVFVLVYRNDVGSSLTKKTWTGIFVLLALGFFIRGPMGVVIPVAVICSYYALTNQWNSIFKVGVPALALLITCWFVLLFLARLEGGEQFVADVVRMQVTGRLSGSDVVPPHYYYLVNGLGNFAFTFPFALIITFVVSKIAWPHLGFPVLKTPVHNEWNSTLRMATLMAGWLVVLLIGLSIPQAKKSRYLLPAVPEIAALASYSFVAQGSRVISLCYHVLQRLLLVLPMVLMAITIYVNHYVKQQHLSVEFHDTVLLLGLGFCQLIQLGLVIKAEKSDLRDKFIVMTAVIAFWATNVLLREPVDAQMHSARDFVRQVETLRQQRPAPLVLYDISRDSIDIVYHVNVEGEFKPLFIDQPADLKALEYPVYLMVKDGNKNIVNKASATAVQVEWPHPIHEGFFRDGSYSIYYLEHSP